MFQKRTLGYFDWVLVVAIAAATGLGLLMLYSTTNPQGAGLFYRQLMWLCVALAVFAVVVVVDYRFWAGLAIPAYALSCLALLVILFQARAISGAKSL